MYEQRSSLKTQVGRKTPANPDAFLPVRYYKTLYSSITVSTCAVLGNMSTAVAVWAL